MKSLKLITSILLVAFVLNSCSKEKKIENRLTKNSGKWEIKIYTYNGYLDDNLENSYSINDVGAFTFNDDGSYNQTLSFNGSTISIMGKWSNSASEIILTDSEGIVEIYDISEDSKSKMTLTTIENPGPDRNVHKFDIERK